MSGRSTYLLCMEFLDLKLRDRKSRALEAFAVPLVGQALEHGSG